ncbi:uncharacterized protein LOC135357127 isoform X1 [Latimeria chalumnae]|uniref:uncharacterized protein LOC135357127 isoform X1 n=1 Tax=Latimeria chalumnae TaxID=7897 RepID=UPI0003C1B2D7
MYSDGVTWDLQQRGRISDQLPVQLFENCLKVPILQLDTIFLCIIVVLSLLRHSFVIKMPPKSQRRPAKEDFFKPAARTPLESGRAEASSSTSLTRGWSTDRASTKDITMQTLLETMNLNFTKLEKAIKVVDEKLTERLTVVENRSLGNEKKLSDMETRIQTFNEEVSQCFNLSSAVVKEKKILKRKLELLENQARACNVRVLGLDLESLEGNLKEYLQKWVPDYLKVKELAEGFIVSAYKLPTRRRDGSKNVPTITFKTDSEKTRNTILTAARKCKPSQNGDRMIYFYPDLSMESQKKRIALREVQKQCVGLNLKVTLSYPAKLKIEVEENFMFWDVQDAEHFLAGRRVPAAPVVQDSDEEVSG